MKCRLEHNAPEIFFVSHSANLYGAEKSLLDLILNLRDDFRICVLVPARGAMTDILQEQGIEYYVLNHKSWIGKEPWLLRMPYRLYVNARAAHSLRKLFKEKRPDLIYTNTIAKPLGALLALCLGIPHVWHIREFVKEGLGLGFDFGERLTMALVKATTTRMICNSRALRERMAQDVPADKIEVVYNGLLDEADRTGKQPRAAPDMSRGPLRLCLVGALQPAKGQEEAIRSLKILKERGVDATLQLVGAGPLEYEQKLRLLAEQNGVYDTVSFQGFRSDALDLLATVDLCLVCSWREAFGRVAVEAMSVGTPVVATDSGGTPEVVEDGVSGLLYRSGDAEMLADRVLTLVRNPALYRTLSMNGLDSVYTRFTCNRSVQQIKEVLNTALRSSHVD